MKFTTKRFLIPVVILLGLTVLLTRNSGPLRADADFVSSYEIGDLGPSGGNIFYIDEFSEHEDFDYLESAPASCEGADLAWAMDANDLRVGLEVVTDWKAKSIGQGLANSKALLEVAKGFQNVETATGYSDTLTCGGQSDWFVPATSELELMYQNLAKQGIGNFTTGYYWSSSAYEYGRAWNQPFSEGEAFDGNKDGKFAVRPIRAF
ncbi:MAG: hypothetical protein RL741_1468 [Actinomycetota bacterium]